MTRHRSPHVVLLALLSLVGTFGAAVAHPAAAQPAASTSRRPHVTRLSALHAEPDPVDGGRIVDAAGRQVLLRGVNVNALVDYWAGTHFPPTFPFDAADADRMAAIGWSATRVAVSWSRIEPQPGRYDESYLDQIAALVDLLGRRGIYSIIDFHQDAWGPTLAARPGEACPSGQSPALGWDGAPGWATLDGAAARCTPAGIRELSPAVRAAFAAFWADAPGPDAIGIRTRYVRMLGVVAGRFARAVTVAGYDVMNEPNAFGTHEQAALADLYTESLRAIRTAEAQRRGFNHLMFFEPSALWSAVGRGAPPDFERDRDVVYAPHIYTGGFSGGPITRDAFEVARDEAQSFGGAPVLTGEWGAAPERAGPGGDPYFADHQRLQDELQFSATLWTWRESCGDPHKVTDLRAGRVPTVWGEFEVDCRTNTVTGLRQDLIADLSRAYVRAAPGRLNRMVYDPPTQRLTAAGASTRRHRTLVAFHPARLARPSVVTTGLRHLRLVPAPGGATYITAMSTGGPWTLDVRGGAR